MNTDRFKIKQNRRNISNAARKLFSNKGLNKTTVHDITSEAQLTPGSLYLYYKSKYDLYALPSLNLLKRLARMINETARKDISVEAKIKRFRVVFIEMYNYDSYALSNLSHLLSRNLLGNLSNDLLQQIIENSILIKTAIAKVIQEGISQKIFVNEHPIVIADLLWADYIGTILWLNSKRPTRNHPESLKTLLSSAFKIFSREMKGN